MIYCQPSLANYTSARNTGVTYNSISVSGSAFASWRNTTSFTQDDNRSDFTDIGFDFWYNGIRYTQFCVSTNGYLDFASSADDGGPVADDFGYDNTAFTNSNLANSTNPAIAPFYDDLTSQGGVDPLGASIKYSLSGTTPNRTLTAEWINMAVYLNTTPSLNFQVKLVETTGQILINYGAMNTGTHVFSYCMGLNGGTISATPTAAQLKELQTVNLNTLNNTVQNNLSAMPTASSQYIFTPPVPTPTAGTLAFSGVGQTSMTLNWTNWAANEVGYVIYNSTDNVNFSFVTQTAANATSTAVSGLLPATTYYWKLYAVTEGCLSAAINGTQATTAAGNKVSNATGNWSNAAIWTPAGVPTAGDNVTIANGHSVTINTDAVCNSLIVGGGTAATLQFGGGTARTLSVNTSFTVNTLAIFRVNTTSNATHSITIKGNITNNSILNFASDANSLCDVVFNYNGNQTISGTGGTTNFNLMTLNMGSSANNVLDITSSNFSAASNFLTLNSGTFKLSTINAISVVPFTGASTISQYTGVWINSANAIVSTSAGITLSGKITVSNGTLNIGNASNEDLLSSGGAFSVTGGVINIAGKYYSPDINFLSNFSISSGTINVPAFGSTSTTDAPFQIDGVGSQFNMSGGVITIVREGGGGGQDFGFINTGGTSGTVTGGTLQIGNSSTPAGQTISINSSISVGNMIINSANATAKFNTNPLNVINHVSISSGTLNVNNLNLTLGGNWLHNGGVFVPGSGTVTFSSTSAQSIFKSGGETFNHIAFIGSGLKTFSSNITTLGNFSVVSGSSVDVSTSNYTLTLNGNFNNNGTFTARSGLVFLNGTAAQTIGGTSTTDFFNLSLTNAAGATLLVPENLIGTLTLSGGIFASGGNLTMISTSTATARIAQITGTGDITGNVTVQRFAPGGSTGWALLGTPISSSLYFSDWDDDIYISCWSCPDGSAGSFKSIYYYNESALGSYSAAASYVPLNDINDPIISNRGYWVYLGDGQSTTNDITLDVTGTVRKFNQAIPLSRTNTGSPTDDGWNLIHNPYPSAISWTALVNGAANIDNAIYVHNPDLNGGTGGYATYINNVSSPTVGAGGIGDNIPMGQGFFTHVTAPVTLTAMESNKVASNPTYLKPNNSSLNPLLRINLMGGNSFNDEAVLYFQEGATNSFNGNFDAYKMGGQDPLAPIISFQNGNNEFQIKSVWPTSGYVKIPIKAVTGYEGAYVIHASNISSFPSNACITLYDKYKHVITDLKMSDYVFMLEDTTTAARFELGIYLNSENSQSNCQIKNNTPNNLENITVKTISEDEFLIEKLFSEPISLKFQLFDVSGRLIKDYNERYSESLQLSVNLKDASAGIYFLKISSENETKVLKLPAR